MSPLLLPGMSAATWLSPCLCLPPLGPLTQSSQYPRFLPQGLWHSLCQPLLEGLSQFLSGILTDPINLLCPRAWPLVSGGKSTPRVQQQPLSASLSRDSSPEWSGTQPSVAPGPVGSRLTLAGCQLPSGVIMCGFSTLATKVTSSKFGSEGRPQPNTAGASLGPAWTLCPWASLMLMLVSPFGFALKTSKFPLLIWTKKGGLWHDISVPLGFTGGTSSKEPSCQCRTHKRHEFDPWVGKIPWRRAWQPTPVFWPGESHGWKSMVGYSPQGHKYLDMTKWLSMHAFFCHFVEWHPPVLCNDYH